MCRFFSGIITKKGIVFDFDNDSHEFLLEKAKLDDTTKDPQFVRVELLQEDNDIFNFDLSTWKISIDQDLIPVWFDKKIAEERMKKAITEVFEQRFIVDNKNWQKRENQRLWIKNSSVVARENSSVEAWGNSSVVARGNSSVEARENSSVEARGNSSVVARENSSVEAWETSSVEAWENSSVVARENSSVVARENSSVEAWGNSSVNIPYSTKIKIKEIKDNASVKDLSSNKPKIIVANPSFILEQFKK